ncbi:chromosome partitioning protein ParA, partial [Klebsiella pneumoniae]
MNGGRMFHNPYPFIIHLKDFILKWFTEFGHLNRGDMLTSEQHRCHNE